MLASAERLADRLSRWLAVGSGLLLLGLALLGVIDATSRYVLAAPIAGTVEVTELLLAVVIFAALPYATHSDQHVVIDSFADRLPVRPRQALRLFGAVALAALFVVVSWQMAVLALEYLNDGRTTLGARIPVLPFLLLGLLAMLAATGVAVVRCLSIAATPRSAS